MASVEIDRNGNERIECFHCLTSGEENRWFHRLDVHLNRSHSQDVDDYRRVFPAAPVVSEFAQKRDRRGDPGPSTKAKKKAKAKTKAQAKRKASGPAGTAKNPFRFRSGIELTMRTDLTPADLERVPAHDPEWEMSDEEVAKWELFAIAVETGENLLDVGPTGCGKTSGIKQFAATLNQPIIRIQCTGDARLAHFVGEKVVEIDDATGQSVVVWKDGILTKAIRHGWWLILDELDACPPQILFVLHSVLEPGGTLTLAENGGEVVVRHPHFAIKASANTLGRGDESGLYEGTQVLNEAFLDRFETVLNSGYPGERAEIKILVKKTGIAHEDAAKMRKIAARVREGQAKEECDCTFSTRRLLAWARKCKHLTPVEACAVAVLNKLGGTDRVYVRDIVQRFFGGEVT